MSDRLNEIRAEIARLEAEAKELEIKIEWVTYADGSIGGCNKANPTYKSYETQGRVFDTQAEAEWFSKFERAQAKLRSLNKGFVPDWGDVNQDKWVPVIADINKLTGKAIWGMRIANIYSPGQIPFASYEDLEAAIEAMGDQMDDLKPFKGV